MRAEEMVARFEHPTEGSYQGFTRAWNFGRTPGPAPFAAPALDQHGEALKADADRARREPD